MMWPTIALTLLLVPCSCVRTNHAALVVSRGHVEALQELGKAKMDDQGWKLFPGEHCDGWGTQSNTYSTLTACKAAGNAYCEVNRSCLFPKIIGLASCKRYLDSCGYVVKNTDLFATPGWHVMADSTCRYAKGSKNPRYSTLAACQAAGHAYCQAGGSVFWGRSSCQIYESRVGGYVVKNTDLFATPGWHRISDTSCPASATRSNNYSTLAACMAAGHAHCEATCRGEVSGLLSSCYTEPSDCGAYIFNYATPGWHLISDRSCTESATHSHNYSTLAACQAAGHAYCEATCRVGEVYGRSSCQWRKSWCKAYVVKNTDLFATPGWHLISDRSCALATHSNNYSTLAACKAAGHAYCEATCRGEVYGLSSCTTESSYCGAYVVNNTYLFATPGWRVVSGMSCALATHSNNYSTLAACKAVGHAYCVATCGGGEVYGLSSCSPEWSYCGAYIAKNTELLAAAPPPGRLLTSSGKASLAMEAMEATEGAKEPSPKRPGGADQLFEVSRAPLATVSS